MNFVEFLGFFILVLAFIVSGVQKAREAKRRKEHPEEFEKEEKEREEALRELFSALGIPPDKPVKKSKLPPPPPPLEKKEERTPLRFAHKKKEQAKERVFVAKNIEVEVLSDKPHRISGRELVVSKEIFDAPLALRDRNF